MHGRGPGFRKFVAGLALLLAMAGWGGVRAADEIRYFTIGTAATSGTYFPIGALLASIISNPPGSRPCDVGGSCGVPGLIAVAQSTQGSVENVKRIGAGTLQSALSQSDVATWAYTGTGIFRKHAPIDNLRAIANLYPEDVHIVVRKDSGIGSIADLRGKRVSVGEQESGTLVEATEILKAYGIGLKNIKPSYDKPGHAADRLAAGEIDAFFQVSGSPVMAVAELAQRVPIDLLPIPQDKALEIIKSHPFLTISATLMDTYENVGLTPTISVGAIWVVAADVDEELVYQITRSLWNESNRTVLEQGHPKGFYIQPSTAVRGLAIPLHPGAERYYREIGLIN